MFNILKHIKDVVQDKTTIDNPRSGKWPAVRLAYLKEHPVCAVCGGNEKLEVHHKQPFHIHPELELDPTNFITLCESMKNGLNCHLLQGHLGNFKCVNVNVIADTTTWNDKIKNRDKTLNQ